MKNKENIRVVSSLKYLEGMSFLYPIKRDEDFYHLYESFEPELSGFLKNLRKNMKASSPSLTAILETFFCFEVYPADSRKVHFVSFLLGIENKKKLPFRSFKNLFSNLALLNEMFEGLLVFKNGGPFAEIVRVWQKNPQSSYWYWGD